MVWDQTLKFILVRGMVIRTYSLIVNQAIGMTKNLWQKLEAIIGPHPSRKTANKILLYI